jgi:hypothetical protein
LTCRDNPLKFVDPEGEYITLKSGTSKADADVIVDALVSVYMRQLGNETLDAMESSSKNITIGVGELTEAPGTSANVVDHGNTRLESTEPC